MSRGGPRVSDTRGKVKPWSAGSNPPDLVHGSSPATTETAEGFGNRPQAMVLGVGGLYEELLLAQG